MQQYFAQDGLVRKESPVRVFAELDDAIEWIEDCLIDEAALARGEEKPLELQEIELFKDRKSETLAAFGQFIAAGVRGDTFLVAASGRAKDSLDELLTQSWK